MSILSIAMFFHFLMGSMSSGITEVPNAAVTTFEGTEVQLDEYLKSDKIKIVSLWATWCGPCRQELAALHKVYPSWKKDLNVEIIAVTLDNKRMVKKAKEMADTNGWDYTFFVDSKGELSSKLGIKGIPYSLLIDQKGKVVSVSEGYYSGYEKELEGKIRKLSSSK